MKNIVISIYNGLLSEMIATALHESGEFMPLCAPFDKTLSISKHCQKSRADLLLMEVAYNANTTLETRMKQITAVREAMPACKIVLLCDENSAPDIARKVTQAKKDGLIDGFFYSSVGAKYLIAALDTL